MNNVKKAETNSGEGPSPGRCHTEQQGGPSCHRATAKGGSGRKWCKQVNRILLWNVITAATQKQRDI